MRLIDADELKKLRHDYIQGRIKFDGNEYDLIDKCPTIEVETVKHGRWIEVKQPDRYGLRVMQECSCCGSRENWRANYCPNCGAKMDGGTAND